MDEKIVKDVEVKMEKTLSALKGDLNKVRTGRASPALFDDIRIDYYGTPTPLHQVATLAVPEPRLINIQPWDTTVIGEIEKAILKSELGVTPANDGKIIRITIPRLTEERRKELVKVVKKMGEGTKVAMKSSNSLVPRSFSPETHSTGTRLPASRPLVKQRAISSGVIFSSER